MSAAIAMLAQREQFHQLQLTEHIIPSSTLYQEMIRRIASYLMAAGATAADAQRQATAWLGRVLQMQVSPLSYIDVFWCFAIVAGLMVPAALLLSHSIEQRPAHPMAH